jgi:hypothetical protein
MDGCVETGKVVGYAEGMLHPQPKLIFVPTHQDHSDRLHGRLSRPQRHLHHFRDSHAREGRRSLQCACVRSRPSLYYRWNRPFLHPDIWDRIRGVLLHEEGQVYSKDVVGFPPSTFFTLHKLQPPSHEKSSVDHRSSAPLCQGPEGRGLQGSAQRREDIERSRNQLC